MGYEAGTLHVFEMPRSLSRAVHQEKQSFANFIDREIKLQAFLSDQTEESEPTQSALLDAQQRPTTQHFETETADDYKDEYVLSAEELKHEEQFMKVEAMFIKEVKSPYRQFPNLALMHVTYTAGLAKRRVAGFCKRVGGG